jgi:hypothetical protein
VLLGALLLAAPAAALAGNGGAAFEGDDAEPTLAPDGSSILAPAGELLGDALEVEGVLPRVTPGAAVLLQRQDEDGTWTTAATTSAAEGGAFAVSWLADAAGRHVVRAVPAEVASGAQAAAATPLRQVTVFPRARATFFGPGLYGRRTACGRRLTRSLVGVAHRSLPCGTRVALLYEGRRITVPVVDRGPFRRGVTYDLTSAAAQELGFDGVGTIGALRVPSARR